VSVEAQATNPALTPWSAPVPSPEGGSEVDLMVGQLVPRQGPPAPGSVAALLVAKGMCALEFAHRPGLRIARYFRHAGREGSDVLASRIRDLIGIKRVGDRRHSARLVELFRERALNVVILLPSDRGSEVGDFWDRLQRPVRCLNPGLLGGAARELAFESWWG
jgi:hypothetical protein